MHTLSSIANIPIQKLGNQIILAAEEVTFSYDTRLVIERASLNVQVGEFVGLVGPNGSGKTTLLRLLIGFLPVSSGEILLCGERLSKLSRNAVARRITLVPQDTRIDLAFRVREVVSMGRTPYLGRFRPEGREDKVAVKVALRVTETEYLAERLVTELSGGERQRVIIARAIAQDTQIILLDEPTSNLDVGHQLEILELVRSLTRQGRCAVAALHDLSLAARFCDRILLMSGGRLVADGTPHEVLTEANLGRYFGIQARLEDDEGTGGLMIWPLAPIKKGS